MPVEDAERSGEHDPTGLDLARQLALGVRGTSKRGTSRKRRRPRPEQAKNRDMEPLSLALGEIIKSEGWERDLAVQAVFARWSSIVGADIAAHSKPDRLAEKVLTVRADSTAWATSLRTIASQLVARLNAELGQGEVEQVKILGPDAPNWSRGRRTVRGGRGPRDTYG